MAAPTLQAQGNIAANTTGDLSVALPAYDNYDIVVVQSLIFAPNTVGTPFNNASMASPWQAFSSSIGTAGSFVEGTIPNEQFNIWWARATSTTSLGTTATITRGGNWDTGNDTVFAGRAYVIRGCEPNGDPYDDTPGYTTPVTTANAQLPAETVRGIERLVIHFMAKSDNTTNPTAATGYTVGTNAASTTGTDASFQTYRRTADADVTAVTPTGGAANAANNGSNTYFSVVFRPNNPRRFLIT